MTSVLHIEHLTNRFGNHVVHDDLHLDILSHQTVAIVGGSGTGKSLLLRTCLGLHTPQSGTITWEGEPLEAFQDQLALKIGVLFQNGALLSSETVLDNLMLPLRLFQQDDEHHRRFCAEQTLAAVGLDPSVGDRYPSELSGGMQRRAALARALMLSPGILCLDEPTAGLDPITANGFDELIAHLRATKGITVIMITHDIDSIVTLNAHVIFLGAGKIIAQGDFDTLRTHEDPIIQDYFQSKRVARLAGACA